MTEVERQELQEIKGMVRVGFREMNEVVGAVRDDVIILKNREYITGERVRQVVRDEIAYREQTERDTRDEITQVKNLVKKPSSSTIPIPRPQPGGLSPEVKDMIIKIAIGVLSVALTAAGFGIAG